MAAIATDAIPAASTDPPRSRPTDAASLAVAEEPRGVITCFAGCDSARRRNRARAAASLVRVAELDRTARSAREATAGAGTQDDIPPLNAIECVAGCGKRRSSAVIPDAPGHTNGSRSASPEGLGRILIRRGSARAKSYSAN
jgi:hypothetical protein